MTLSTSLVAVWYSSRLRKFADRACDSFVLACSASNNRVFSMAMTAWSAKVLQEFNLAAVKATRQGTRHGDGANWAGVFENWNGDNAADAHGLRERTVLEFCIFVNVRNFHNRSCKNRAGGGTRASWRSGIRFLQNRELVRFSGVGRHIMNEVPIVSEHIARLSLTQYCRALRDCIEYRLDIGR